MNMKTYLLILGTLLLFAGHASAQDHGSGAGLVKGEKDLMAGGGGACLSCPAYDMSITPGAGWLTSSSSHGSNDCVIYRVAVMEGQFYTFKTGCDDGATADYDTMLELMDGTCGTVAINDDYCEAYSSLLEWTATYTGFAYLKVSGYEDEGGSFTLAYLSEAGGVCMDCPSHDLEIDPTTTWQTSSSSHGINGCTIYRVAVTSGESYFFQTGCGNGATADYDTYLSLMNESCTVILEDDDNCEENRSAIVWTSYYTGFAYLKVEGYGGSGGAFTLAYSSFEGASLCMACPGFDMELTPTLAWQTTSSEHVMFGCRTYKIPMTAGQTYTFQTGCGNGATATYDTMLELADENCMIVEFDDDGCEEALSQLIVTAVSTGDMYLRVLGYSDSFGSFTLAYAREGSVGSNERDAATWSMFPNPGNGVFTLANGTGSDIIQVQLFDMAGRMIFSRNERIPAQVQSVIDAGDLSTGIYMVRVLTSDNKRSDRRLVVH
jgi:hypothetical protein